MRTIGVLDGHDDRPVGLGHRLAAEAGGEARSVHRRAPRQTAIGRGAHPDKTVGGLAGIVPLQVAMAEEWAAGGVVAGNPLLVGIVGGADDDRRSPIHRIRRAAHSHEVGAGGDQQRSHNPDSVRLVEDNGRIAGRQVRAANRDGKVGQEAVRPTGAAVGRSRKAEVGSTAVEPAASLECGHNRRARGEHAGFDLGGVLAVGVGESVGAQTRDGELLRRRRRGGFRGRALRSAATSGEAQQGRSCEHTARADSCQASSRCRHVHPITPVRDSIRI